MVAGEAHLFLGIDTSSRALKVSLISNDLSVVSEAAKQGLPKYGTQNGLFLDHGGEVTSPVMVVVEEMDLIYDLISESRCRVGGILWSSCCG